MTWTTLQRFDIGTGLACHRSGQGEPVVLIHGVGLRAEAWGAQIPVLARYFDVIAIDLPGHGHSALLSSETPSLADVSDAIAAAIQSVGRPVHLVGHSLGALISLDCAIRFPELCRSLVPMNAIFQRTADAKRAVQARARALLDGADAGTEQTLARWFGDRPRGYMGACAEACRSWLLQNEGEGYARAYRVFSEQNGPSAKALKQLDIPVTFVTGADDPNSLPHMSQAMADLVPCGQAVSITGAAHMLPMTHAEDVNQRLIKTMQFGEVEHV